MTGNHGENPRGRYRYSWNEDWIKLEGNTWANKKVYDVFLYYDEPDLGGYEKIIGYVKLPETQ